MIKEATSLSEVAFCFLCASISLFFFHHLNKEEKDNESNKVVHWIVKDAHL